MNTEEPQQSILVVDDEPTNIQVLGNLLKDEYRIRVANSGEKALAMIRAGNQPLPDLILLDIQMPGIDGYEVCQRLKEDPNTSTIAIIFVSESNASSRTSGHRLMRSSRSRSRDRPNRRRATSIGSPTTSSPSSVKAALVQKTAVSRGRRSAAYPRDCTACPCRAM
jgi:CheY-like chemotaxis protein